MEIMAAAESFSECFADEVFVEMKRQRFTNNDLALALGITPHTAGSRINRKVPFNAVEMSVVSAWLGIGLEVLVDRAKRAASARKEKAA